VEGGEAINLREVPMAVSEVFPARLARMFLLVLLLPACSGSSSPTGSSNGSGADVRIVQGASTKTTTAFSPATFTVSMADGGKVTWYNADFTSGGGYGGGTMGVMHSLISDDGRTFMSGNMSSQHSYTKTFPGTGTFNYHCSIHPGMVGTIIVGP
jgi:plastocyanin